MTVEHVKWNTERIIFKISFFNKFLLSNYYVNSSTVESMNQR